MGRLHLVRVWATALWAASMIGAAVAWPFLAETIDSMAGVLFAAVCFVMVGAILVVRVPSNVIGPLALTAGSAWVLYMFGGAYGVSAVSAGVEPPLGYLLGWVGSWIGAFMPLALSLLILVFPTGRPRGWWRLVAVGPLAGMVSVLVGAYLFWGLPLATLVTRDLIDQVGAYPLVDAGFIVGFLSAVLATVSVVVRFRKGDFTERQQIKWLLAASSVFAVSYLIGAASDDSNETIWWVLAFAVAAIPVSILVAVLRYRLYEVDRILSRTFSYAIVLGVLGAVYLLGLAALSSMFPSGSPLAVAASTLAVAALFNPLRKRIHDWVDRRFNRSRYDAAQVMDGFAGSLQDRMDPDGVVEGWVGVVARTMQPSAVGVWVKGRVEQSIRNDPGTVPPQTFGGVGRTSR